MQILILRSCSLRTLLSLAILLAVFSPLHSFANTAEEVRKLQLLPEPKEVKLGNGNFRLDGETKIVVQLGHQAEDRIAAETLVEEVEQQSGMHLQIASAAQAGSKGREIVLARLDEGKWQKFLEAQGLKADSIGDQGYLLFADKTRIVVGARTGQGLFYGVQTLRQLLRPDGRQMVCPAVSIRDWPSMEWRGVQDDISRGPIPTMDFMKKQIRTLAAYKVNMFGLYMEHVFDFAGHPLVAPKEAALTPDRVRDLVAYAARYHVTVLPEQQTFGHLHNMLKYEIYSDVAERPHGHVLTPTKDASYDIIRSMYAETVPLFPGPFLHIGGDETFELGKGQTAARAADVGLGRVYLEHLQKVSAILGDYHKRLIFWGDIALKYPTLLGILPKDIIAMPWDYDAKASFENEIKPYRDAGLTVMVAPGVSNWSQVWPNLDTGYANIRNFVRDGQALGAIGMMNTMWNDDGESLPSMAWPGLVFGAAAAWQPGESTVDDFKNAYDWSFYRNQGTTFRDVMENLDRAHQELAKVGWTEDTDSLCWADPFSPAGAKLMHRVLPAAQGMRLGAEQAATLIYRNGNKARANADAVDDMLLAAWRWDSLGMKIQYADEIGRFYWDAYQNQTDHARVDGDLEEIASMNARLNDLRDATTRVREMYRQRWMKQYQPYWIDNVLVRYDTLAQELQAKIVEVRTVQQQFDATKTLPAPEELGFYLHPAAVEAK